MAVETVTLVVIIESQPLDAIKFDTCVMLAVMVWDDPSGNVMIELAQVEIEFVEVKGCNNDIVVFIIESQPIDEVKIEVCVVLELITAKLPSGKV